MESSMDNKQVAENIEDNEIIKNEDISYETKTDIQSGQNESMQKTDEIKENIQNGYIKNENLKENINQESVKNSVINDNTEKNDKNEQVSYEKTVGDEFNIDKTNIHKYEILTPHFIKGIYEPINDIFSEENKNRSYINIDKTTTSLLPGYKSVTFEELNNPNYNINNIHQNNMYPSSMFYPPFNYIPIMNCNNLKEAYILKNNVMLNNYLLTSADISKGTIHRQYNVGVTYPYGVPYIDVRKIKNSYSQKKTKI